MLHQAVFDTSEVCHQLGISNVVVSPGSRNAPLILSFARNSKIKKYIIPDERSAAFIALGIAQAKKEPVALCCTSGTAVLNYAPAIAEAFYRQIPLVVFSADRPPELIDQRDGQTIRQFEALKNHVKYSVQLPVVESDDSGFEYIQKLKGSIDFALNLPLGPVHINVPFREPFYPESDKELDFSELSVQSNATSQLFEETPHIQDYEKILVLLGQGDPDEVLDPILKKLSNKIPIVSTSLSNIQTGIKNADAFIKDQKELQPDLLITSGLSVLSKNLKTYLRKYTPKEHIHFDPAGVEVDTYQTNPRIIKNSIVDLCSQLDSIQVDSSYLELWNNFDLKSRNLIHKHIDGVAFSESKAAHFILQKIPKDSILHLSNSMPVRYLDIFGSSSTEIYSNRGTSGIDGCTSTAVGNSLTNDQLNILITGDLAFLYDRNAFFHNYQIPNLRVIVLNNLGGGIFRLINGPSHLPELEKYFETRHNRSAEYICAENNLNYCRVENEVELSESWYTFLQSSDTAKVLEVLTDPVINQSVYKELRKYLHEHVNN